MQYELPGVSRADAASIAGVLTGSLDVRIREGKSWSYNFEDQCVNYRPEDLLNLYHDEVTSLILHECGHAKYSTAPHLSRYPGVISNDHIHKLHLVINAIEDLRIEDQLRAYYPFGQNFLPEDSLKVRLVLANVFGGKTKEEVPIYVKYCLALYEAILGYHSTEVEPEIKEVLDITLEAGKKARLQESTQQLTEVVCVEIYPHIKKWLDKYVEDEEQQQIGCGLVIKNMPGGRKIKNEELRRIEEVIDPPQYFDMYSELRPIIKPTIRSFQRILTDNRFDKHGGKYTSGKLNQRKLYKFRNNDLKLFERRIIAKTKEYTFGLLVDESGSMTAGARPKHKMTDECRIYAATKAAILFANVLENLDINYGLWGFNGGFRPYRPIGHNKIDSKLKANFENMIRSAWGPGADSNCDGHAIEEVNKTLSKYPGRRVLLVISDGQPYPCYERKHTEPDLKKQVKLIEKQGTTVIGIGIGDSQEVKKYYKHSVVVSELRELPIALITVLKNVFKKS